MNDHDYAEKRDFIRMFIDAPVEFSRTGSNEWYEASGKDLSGSGLSFTTKETLFTGDSIEVKLNPVTAVTPPLEARVTVIRTDKNENGEYLVSTKIVEIIE